MRSTLVTAVKYGAVGTPLAKDGKMPEGPV